MATVTSMWVIFFPLLLVLNFVGTGKSVPCYFIFGDSLVDNGNNNAMASFARANYMPYGIDFPEGPTGRFCNGLTTTDVIAKLLGFNDYIPPYVYFNAQQDFKGINFASAAGGIREESGRQLGDRLSFDEQLKNYQGIVEQMVGILGDEESTSKYLRKCIFSVGLGSNDYLNNYFMPDFYPTSSMYDPEQFSQLLIQQYSQQLTVLYNWGARKVALIGIGMIGCSPNELSKYSDDGVTCVEPINNAVKLFNSKLISLVDDLNKNLKGANFIYVNGYGIFEDILKKPASHGLTVTNVGCCGVGRNHGQITCLPLETPCENRSQYLFWDAFHPSEVANKVVAKRFFMAESPSDAYPMDIHHLAQI